MANKSTHDHHVAHRDTSDLPAITDLIQDSWKLFEKTAIIYVKLFVLIAAFLLVGILIGFIIALPLSLNAFSPNFNAFLHPAGFSILLLIVLLVWLILYLLIIIGVGIMFPIVSLFILQEKKKEPLISLIKQSKPYILPYFITLLLSSLITLGGVFLFVIPGLIIGVFFVFVIYEVVLDGQTGRAAIKRSYILVRNHFWEIIVRLFILEIGILIISSILNDLAGGNWLLELVKFLFSVFSIWYSRAYVYLLYQQVRARTTFPEHISIRWIWIVSGIGWFLVLALMMALSTGAVRVPGMMHAPHHYMVPRGTV